MGEYNLKRIQLKQDWITRTVTEQTTTKYSKEPNIKKTVCS